MRGIKGSKFLIACHGVARTRCHHTLLFLTVIKGPEFFCGGHHMLIHKS